MARNYVRVGVGVKDDASGPIDRIRDKFEKIQKQGGKGFAIGVGAAATTAAFGLLSSAAGQVVDVLGDAKDAALEEERSLAMLDAALRANVEGYDGNTAAIEETIAARMKLGWADDEQRESLARLVSVTKDSTKALQLQRTAMDLARLRGIDLGAASDIVGKVYGGNIGILARYGIQLRKGVSATEALAEIQRRAAGQAEAYAKTNEGRLLASQIKVGEAMEKLGAVTLPAIVTGTEAAADAIETLSGHLDTLSVDIPVIDQSVTDLGGTLLEAFNVINPLDTGRKFEAIADYLDDLGVSTDAFRETFGFLGVEMVTEAEKSASAVRTYMRDAVKDDLHVTEGAFEDLADTVDESTGDVETSFADMVDSMITNTERLIADVFDPIETRAEIYQARMEQNAAEERLRDAETAREKREATDDILGSIRDQADGLVELGEQGELTAEDIDRFEKDVKQSYKALGKEVPQEIAAIIAALRKLDKWDGHKVNVNVNAYVPGIKGGGKGHLASGGPGAGPTIVGEQGPEVVDLPPGSFVHHAQSPVTKAALAGGGPAVYNFNLTVQGDIKARDGEEILRTMRRLEAVSKPMGAWHG